LSRIELETRWFPLILQRWPADITDPDLDEFFRALDDIARRAQRQQLHYAVVVWGRSTDIDASRRRRIARWVRAQPPELRERNVGSFLVLSSAMQRGAVTALRWILPELQDVHAFSTIGDAAKAALSALRTKNLSAPVNVEEVVRSIGPAAL
jgi:hypothetical protein